LWEFRKVKENYAAVLRNAKAVEATDMSRGAKHVYHKVHIQILADYYHFLRVKGVFVLLMNHFRLCVGFVLCLFRVSWVDGEGVFVQLMKHLRMRGGLV
jgi:hypothetical protein